MCFTSAISMLALILQFARSQSPESLILSSERPKNSHLWISLCILVRLFTFYKRGLKTAGEDGFSWFCSRLIQMKNRLPDCEKSRFHWTVQFEPDFGPKLCSCGHLDHGFVTLVNAWHLNELKWRFWVTQDMSNWKCFVQFNDFMNVCINIFWEVPSECENLLEWGCKRKFRRNGKLWTDGL